jgi:ABC-2 type transport system permease protein
MRSSYFSVRNIKEILRDPLSYIFCLGFPIVMLIIMTIVNSSIPAQAHMTIFQIQNLAPGIAVFGLTFTMLFTCLSVSKDRAGAFLTRLYASPMKGIDFIVGYTLPLMIIAIAQSILTYLASILIGAFTGYTFSIGRLLLSMLVLLPSMLLFVGFGLLFGTLFNEKAAPGLCSIIISVAGMLGGIWMDVDVMGGPFAAACKCLPFYHGVKAARMAVLGEYGKIGMPLLIVCAYAIVVYALAVFTFRKKMQNDLR